MARSQLATLGHQDAILDCFFEQSHRLFEFAALFVLRGEMAHGRNVHGLGASEGMISRLSLPLSEQGLLAKARELRRPFITSGATGEGDEKLFGNLGRTLPAGVVVPLVVRDRVVAIFLGDGPKEALNARAEEAGRSVLDLAKEEMLIWSESVSEALERLILRRKGGSIPPPPGVVRKLSSRPPPPRFDSRPPVPLVPLPPLTPTFDHSSEGSEGSEALSEPLNKQQLGQRTVVWVLGVGVVLLLLGGGVVAWRRTRQSPNADAVVLAANALPGGPSAIDPRAALVVVQRSSGLGEHAELASIEAEVSEGGNVDLGTTPTGATALGYAFVVNETVATLRVDRDGVRAPVIQAKKNCDGGDRGGACAAPVPAPQCAFAKIWSTSSVAPNKRALITYEDGREHHGEAGPEWVVAVMGRGRVRLDAKTCEPLPRERLRPPPLALAAIPGAPHKVDPLELSSLALKQSGLETDAVLLEIDARGVDASGHVDLAETASSIVFTFADPVNAANAANAANGATKHRRRWREVRVNAAGVPAIPDDNGDPPPARFFNQSSPNPLCTLPNAFAYATLATNMTDHADAAATAAVKTRMTYAPDLATRDAGRWTVEVGAQRFEASDAECDAWVRLRRKK